MPRFVAIAAAVLMLTLSGSATAQLNDPRLRQQPLPSPVNPQLVGPGAIECGAGTTLRVEGGRRTCVAAPTASASRAWIVHNIDGPTHGFIYVVNPSDGVARVGFTIFDQAGTMVLDRASSVNVAAGAIGAWSNTPEASGARRYWVLVTSDRPVLVDAETATVGGARGGATARQLSAHRLDCANPEGYEFACRVVNATRR